VEDSMREQENMEKMTKEMDGNKNNLKEISEETTETMLTM
jgi:hypothetical protein